MANVPDPSFDVARVRADFPALHETVHGRPLVYLDNAATTQKPRAVVDAIVRHYVEGSANVHRGVHALSERATDAFESARRRVQRFVGAVSPREIVFVRGATEGINLVAGSWGAATLREGDEVLVSALEHHSNLVPWQLLCERVGARLQVAPIDDRGQLVLEEFERRLTPRTRLVAVTWVSNALGTIVPVHEIVQLAHAAGALVLVDAAQAAPHLAIDVVGLGCDFLVLSGHKLYGPTGSGALWARQDILDRMPPWQSGGEMIERVSFAGTTFATAPQRFEAGTPDVAAAIGLGAAIGYLEGLDRGAIRRHEHALLVQATAALEEVGGLRIVGTAGEKAAVLSFVLEGIDPHEVGTLLDLEGIATRTGHHCAMPATERLGVAASVRASFGLYNTSGEVQALARALHAIRAEA